MDKTKLTDDRGNPLTCRIWSVFLMGFGVSWKVDPDHCKKSIDWNHGGAK